MLILLMLSKNGYSKSKIKNLKIDTRNQNVDFGWEGEMFVKQSRRLNLQYLVGSTSESISWHIGGRQVHWLLHQTYFLVIHKQTYFHLRESNYLNSQLHILHITVIMLSKLPLRTRSYVQLNKWKVCFQISFGAISR